MIAVTELLEALGSDADAIAAFLRQHGFRGARGVGEDCPLANYLKANGISEPAVNTSSIMYVHEGRLIIEDVSQPVEDFVMLFDDEEYPDLEVEPLEQKE